MRNDSRLDDVLTLVDRMEDAPADERFRVADSRDGSLYRHDERTRVALKVALITGRPLLLVGPPGCGKSSLAPYVARNLRMPLLTYTVTEAAEASDLLWRIDYVRRLNDAQSRDIKPIEHYVEPGVLWRAFQPETSANNGDGSMLSLPPWLRSGHIGDGSAHAVAPAILGTTVLIDEIDKANANFANSLLVAIGSLEFDVPPLGNRKIKAADDTLVLVVMTSNEERELPPALLRRCVTLSVAFPTAAELVEITQRLWPTWMREPAFRSSVESLANSLASRDSERVSTAEFLDLVQVLRKSGVAADEPLWRTIEGLILLSGADAS